MTTLPIADLRNQYHHLKNIVNEAELFMAKLNAYALEGDLIPNAATALLQIKTQLQPQIDVLASEIDYRANYYKKYQRLCSFKTMTDLPDKIQSVKSRINQAQAVIAKKRKPLTDDDISENIAALTYPDYDSTTDSKKIEELQYQLDAWIGFQNYQHPDFLPTSEDEAAKSMFVK